MTGVIDMPAMVAVLDRHERVALSFSGGKDSLACVYGLRDHLHRMTVYHMDTGDLLPETATVVEHVKQFAPKFCHIHGDIAAAIDRDGLPTDLLPHSAHWMGQMMGEGPKLVARYDCCGRNLMQPLYDRVVDDGNTLLIRGTKAVDMARLPTKTGDVLNGVEMLLPLEGWTTADVLNYLEAVGAPRNRIYDHMENSPECARCSAWWTEGKSAYLKRYHPVIWVDYQTRLRSVVDAIEGPLGHLRRELSPALDHPPASRDEVDAASRYLWQHGTRILQGNRLAPTDMGHVERLLRAMRPPPGSLILDVGCGFGEVPRLMQLLDTSLKFVLLTNSSEQISRVPKDMIAMLGDMHHTAFDDDWFDGAMFLYSLCHADVIEALREAARIVRPGGFLFVYDYARIGGDNVLTERVLAARFHSVDAIEAMAADAGWRLDTSTPSGGDDSLFRSLFNDDEGYDGIFRHLMPMLWRFERAPHAPTHEDAP